MIRVVTATDRRGFAVVEVRDTGAGMSAAVRARIFEPFFTTKPLRIGTGLGLPICHKIVTAHGGEIAVESEECKGTVVRVALPPAAPPQATAPPPAAPAPANERRGRVLIIDDDAQAAAGMARLLGRDHDATISPSGADALERIERGEDFDVIFCDLMMPVMTGIELFERIRALAPDLTKRVVFITGGAFTPAARRFLEEVDNERLDKPFEVRNLRALVRRMLA